MRRSTDYPRAMIIEILELHFDPTEFGVVHTEQPAGYDVTWFDGPSYDSVQDYLSDEFAKFSKVHITLSRKQRTAA